MVCMGQHDRNRDEKRLQAAGRSAKADDEGWAAYRSWLGQVSGMRGRRVMADSSIYTLQGYKDWTQKIRKDWDPDSTE